MPHTFGNDERVAAQDDRDVMVPAGKPAAFVVIKTEFVLEILVRAFDAPPLHHSPHELFLGEASWKRAEEAVGRGRFVVAPFDQQPHGLALLDPVRVVVGGDNTPKCEPRRERLLGSLPPRTPSKTAMGIDPVREVDDADDLVASSAELVEHHDDRPIVDRDAVVQSHLANTVTKLTGRPIRLVCEDETWSDAVVDRTLDQLQGELGLRGELNVIGNPDLLT